MTACSAVAVVDTFFFKLHDKLVQTQNLVNDFFP